MDDLTMLVGGGVCTFVNGATEVGRENLKGDGGTRAPNGPVLWKVRVCKVCRDSSDSEDARVVKIVGREEKGRGSDVDETRL